MKCSFCGGSNFKEYYGDYICKDCGTKNKKSDTTSTTSTTTSKPLSATTSTVASKDVCSFCKGTDFKEFNGKKICKNCGSVLDKSASTTTTTTTTTATKKPTTKSTTTTTTTSKPLSTAGSAVCSVCKGTDFKEYYGKKICKNCGSVLDATASTTTTTASTATTTTTKPSTKSTSTSKPKIKTENTIPTTKSVETVAPPIRYKYDFSIVFKPSVKLFGFESFTKDKKIADDILHYLISKKYTVSEGYGESSDNEIYSKAIIVVGTKAEYIDSKINEKLNSYKRDAERGGKTLVYYVYDKVKPNGLPIDITDGQSFDSNGDDFLEALSKRFIEESSKY